MSLFDWLARLWKSPPADSPPEEPESPVADPDEPVVMPIEGSIDLHHFAPRDILSVVDEYLNEARRKGFSEVRVIHGKGKGVQRRRVQLLLDKHPAVLSYRSDGLGSTLVCLRARRR
ncbi:MAG: Smr/MutS family protein [Polyangiaceae bacterium]